MMARSVSLPTATFSRDAAGVPYSEQFSDVYHSSHGGLAQSRHVFLGGNGLPQAWAGRDAFTILETGFGLGLNFLAAWDAWRADAGRPPRLHFISVEGHPLRRDDRAQGLGPLEELRALSRALASAWPPP